MKKIYTLPLFLLIAGCGGSEPQEKDSIVSAKYGCAPATTDKEWYLSDQVAPLFEGLGGQGMAITTDNDTVQRYFDQGLILAYGFNHAEAARSFYYATKLEPTNAMAFWGYAYVLGPNYNGGMEDDNYERAYAAIQEALSLSENGHTQKEKDLIWALSTRYVEVPVEDRYPLDEAYSEALKEVYEKYPGDPDVSTLYAESLMNLHPWDLHNKEGVAKEWTPQIIAILEDILKDHPNHAGANHFYIHAVEASATPERGLVSAKRFDDGLVPNSGHLVHMPAHIYIRTGDYAMGTLANKHSIEIDSAYVTACHAQGAYPLAYFPHNQHFMAATATLQGHAEQALYAAEAVSNNANRALMREPMWATLQHFYTIPMHVYVKFGRWDDILAMENETPDLEYPTAMWHYARGMAFLGKNDIDSAQQELAFISEIASHESLKDLTIWEINTVYDLVQIAEKVLHGAILAREANYRESISVLKEAVAIEDGLNYNEPPDWFFSVRHYLGHVQIMAGENESAVQTYRDDLKYLPKNGWALKGLAVALLESGFTEEAAEIESQFEKAWAHSDTPISSSVIP